MIIVLHQVQTYDSPSTVVEVIETDSMKVYEILKQHADKPDIQKLVNQYLKEGKAKRVEFKDLLVEGCDYQQ